MQSPRRNKQFCSLRRYSAVLVSELQKPASPRLEPRTIFRSRDLCSCNLLFETNNFGLVAVPLSCLDSKIQELPSPGLELRTFFRRCNLSKNLLLVSRNKHAKFGANWYIRSRVVSEHTQFQLYSMPICHHLHGLGPMAYSGSVVHRGRYIKTYTGTGVRQAVMLLTLNIEDWFHFLYVHVRAYEFMHIFMFCFNFNCPPQPLLIRTCQCE
jgi:hypothetical protein